MKAVVFLSFFLLLSQCDYLYSAVVIQIWPEWELHSYFTLLSLHLHKQPSNHNFLWSVSEILSSLI